MIKQMSVCVCVYIYIYIYKVKIISNYGDQKGFLEKLRKLITKPNEVSP